MIAPQVWFPRRAMLIAALWSACNNTPQDTQANLAWVVLFLREQCWHREHVWDV